MDEKVKQYIEKQKSSQKEIILALRKIFFETIKNCEEKFGWGVIVLSGGKFYIAAMKSRVHVGFSIIGLNKEEVEFLEGGGKTNVFCMFFARRSILPNTKNTTLKN